MKRAEADRNKLAAFTFAELLVATATLAAITVLVLPALTDSEANVRSAFCLNNLKQWGVGYQLYAADWNGYLPSEGSTQILGTEGCWYNAVPPYLKMVPLKDVSGPPGSTFGQARIFVCPEKNIRSRWSTSGMITFCYGMNTYLDGDNIDDVPHHLRHVNLSAVTKPNLTVLLCDVKANQFYCDPMDTTYQSYPWQNQGQGLHQNGANILFVDGHASLFPVSAYWNGSNGITNNPALRWYP